MKHPFTGSGSSIILLPHSHNGSPAPTTGIITAQKVFITVVLLLFCFSGVIGKAAYSSGVGFTTTRPASITDPPAPFITDNITGPVLTTDWCASLAFSDTSENMFAHPLVFRCTRTGLITGYPNQTVVEPDCYITPFHRDITVTVEGIQPGNALMDWYSDWAVRASWDNGKMKATMAHGSPFVYLTGRETVSLSFLSVPQIWFSSDEVLGISIGDRHYGLFGPPGSTWDTTAPPFASTHADSNYCSIAVLPDTTQTSLQYFKRFAYNVITNTTVSWKYARSDAMLITRYQQSFTALTGNEPNLLIALYPHQWLFYRGSITNYTYQSSRGQMKVIEASAFTTEQPYTGILPHLPMAATKNSTYTTATLASHLDAETAKNADALIRADADTYWTGKDLGRTAQLVRIAQQLGDTTARDHFITVLKSKLEDWCTYDENEEAEFFYYNKPWGALIGSKPSFDSDKSLNDHHFHYGYFIYAAATIAPFDREWASAWKPMIDCIIRDANSPFRTDTLFPFLRSFDVFAGHSWASGNALFPSGNNQESTSEAINFAVGTALWGMATGDTLLRDLGVFLYITEKNALCNYWFDINDRIFPAEYNHTMAGIVWGEKSSYETWFSPEPECIHGINMLPVTAASFYLGVSPAYVRNNFAEMERNNGGPIDQWHDILWEYLVLGDPEAAVNRLGDFPDYTPEEGESRAHTYHWIHTIAALGAIDTSISADAPSYAVFNNGGHRTYAIWNPDDSTKRITFSNRKTCTVPPNTLIAYDEDSMETIRTLQEPHPAATPRKCRLVKTSDGYRLNTPTVQAETITIALFNSAGRKIATLSLLPTAGTASGYIIPESSLPKVAGVYFISLVFGNNRMTFRHLVP